MQVQRTLLWRGLDGFSAEHFSLWHGDGGWRLAGVILLPVEDRPTRVEYRVECDSSWATRAIDVAVQIGQEEHRLLLAADENRQWSVDDVVRPDLSGCTDIDLSATPATNTLPIRRLGLAVGEAREIVAAWIHFPTLAVEPLPQRYTRLAERRYRYESLDDGAVVFTADVAVDELGLVTHYADGWERVAAA